MKLLLITSIIFFSFSIVIAQTSNQEPELKNEYFDLSFNYSLPINAFKSQNSGHDNAGHALQGIGGVLGLTTHFKNSNLGWYFALGYYRNEQQNFLSGKMAGAGDTLLLSNVYHQTIPFLTGPTYRYDNGTHVFYARLKGAVAISGLTPATFETRDIPAALRDETEYKSERKMILGYSVELGYIINHQLSLGLQVLQLGSVEHQYVRTGSNTILSIPKDSNKVQMLNLKIGWVFMHKK